MAANAANHIRLLLVIFLLATALYSASSLAQVQGPVQMDEIRQAAEREGDRSREALQLIFGEIVNNPLAVDGSEETTMVADVFKILNGIGLVVGVFLLGFIVFRKTFAAANDGGLFNRGNDRAFSVLRYVWGFAALVPTVSGWSMAQLVVLWSASLIGVGTANLATDAALNNWYDGGSMVLEPARPETLSLAASVFDANLCAAGINRGIQEANAAGGNLGPSETIQTHTIENTGFILADGRRSHTCGGATYPRARVDTSSYWGVTINTQPYRDAQMNALVEMQGYISQQVEGYASAVFAWSSDRSVQVPSAARIIATAARRYDQALSNSNMSSLSSNHGQAMREAVVNAISQRGWFELGGWYQSMAQANSIASSSMGDRAQAVGQDLGSLGAVTSYYQRLRSYTDRQRAQVSPVSNENDGVEDGDATTVASQDVNKLVGEVFGGSLGRSTTEWFIGWSEADNGTVNPLISMKSLGDNILVGTQSALVGYAVLNAAVGGAEGLSESFWGRVGSLATGGLTSALVKVAKAFTDAISPFVVIAIIILFGFGITLSIYVPFIPFIIWFAAIINWLVFVAIGVVAAPLWAFAHLSGEDNSSRSTHGYLFMFNAMLRPILMVAAFLLAGAILVAGGTLLNELFGPALANAQTDSWTGVVSIIGFIGIYISVCLTLIHTSFNLIFMIPDKVMEWIGGSQLATGQGSEQEQQNAIRALGAYVRDTQRLGGKMPSSGTLPGKNSIQRD